jgi:ectoine hydroxylase-related dioxygenase (phytanoyl-CoA dioxygenase family)
MPGQSAKLSAALAELGVRDDTLTPEERSHLDRDGFVVLHGILSPEVVEHMCRRLDELAVLEGEESGADYMQEKGTVRVGDLVNKDPLFEVCFTHPRVLAAVARVIDGDFRLAATTARGSLPGAGFQMLHADWDRGDRTPPAQNYVANSIWALDAFTGENGATRVVPGSHRWRNVPQRDCPSGRHPDEIPVVMPAGSVAVTNAYLWHGGGENRGTGLRRALHSFFKHIEERRDSHQLYLDPATYARLGEPAKAVLDASYLPSAPNWMAVNARRRLQPT